MVCHEIENITALYGTFFFLLHHSSSHEEYPRFIVELSGKENNIEQAKLMFARLKEEFIKLKNFLPLEKRQNIEQKIPSMK